MKKLEYSGIMNMLLSLGREIAIDSDNPTTRAAQTMLLRRVIGGCERLLREQERLDTARRGRQIDRAKIKFIESLNCG